MKRHDTSGGESDGGIRIITTKQRLAIAALASGLGPTKAAVKAHVSRATLYRWQQDPGFAAAVREAEDDLWADATRHVRELAVAGSARLLRILADAKTTDGAAIRAALGVLALAPRYREMGQLERDVAELRDLVDGLGDGRERDQWRG